MISARYWWKHIVEWSSGEVTVEPAANLENCQHLVDAYDSKIESIEVACATLVSNTTDIEAMVAELQRKQKVEGTVEEWVPGVEQEMESVMDSRLEEVSEEVRQKVLREGTAMKLRMILESKKDGRKKGRWVGQGFWEGLGVTGEHIQGGYPGGDTF